MSWAEAKWVVDQIQQKLGLAPNNMRSFTAYAVSKTSIGLKFLEPADSYDGENLVCAVGGVMVRMSEESYPATPNEGTLVVDCKVRGQYENDPYLVDSLTEGTPYYFSAFPYSTSGVYNQSSDPANRATASPADGETVKVTVDIDDASGFTQATITCVDETEGAKTQKKNVTPSSRDATFVVAIGHSYHIEYGEVAGYSKPANTQTAVAVAGKTTTLTGSYKYFTATITVTYPAGATCTCAKGGTSYQASDTSGTFAFKVHEAGTWTVKAVSGAQTATNTVEIQSSGDSKAVTLSFFSSTIHVTYPAGATCTCEKGQTKLTAPNTSGDHTFTVTEAGTWTVKAVQESQTASSDVSITKSGEAKEVTLSFSTVYGISRDTTKDSPDWTRTDAAVGKTATPTKGTVAGKSDFDNCAPWSGMKREVVDGDTMVKIPKFWFKRWRDGNTEYIQIADKAKDGFAVHPAFKHNGKEQDYIHVGAYKLSSGAKSVTGAAPLVNQTRDAMRKLAAARGTGYSLIDIATWSAIQMLFLVEYATNNSQNAIGRGYCDSNSAAINTGSCDSVTGLTGIPAGTDGKVDVVYRGIEGIWGNVREWVDGVNMSDGTLYICNDQTKYKDDTSEGYTALTEKAPTPGSGYITKETLDATNSHVMLPINVTGGSETTHYCDYGYFGSSWRVLVVGGNWDNGSYAGLFAAYLGADSSYSITGIGSRLLKVPS